MTSLAESLNRTLLLMRDEFGPEIDDSVLLSALTSTRVALIANLENISSHSAQTAFVTAAVLMARSGHQVSLVAPDVKMVGPQPPLQPGKLIDELVKVGKDLLPGFEYSVGEPENEIDLAICFGDTVVCIRARRAIRLNAEAWAGLILPEDGPSPWKETMWPMGALAAAGLAAAEAFKVSMLKLLPHALNPENTQAVFAPIDEGQFELASAGTPFCSDLGEVDCISGGAIVNSTLFCLARIPNVRAHGRMIEPDTGDLTNLNRNMLLLRSGCGIPKAVGLAQVLSGTGLQLEPLLQRFDADLLVSILPLAPTVVVGVDHIPTRWAVQEANPECLVIGATTHWSAMASFHAEGLGCARCLHDKDDPDNGLIPTTACVSFWAGLLTAVYVAGRAAGQKISARRQQAFVTPFRPEGTFNSAVAVRQDCPVCQRRSGGPTPSIAA